MTSTTKRELAAAVGELPETCECGDAEAHLGRVCWEVWPEYALVGGERRQAGFALELSGTHGRGVEHPEAGCDRCRRVYSALREIARSVLPQEERMSMYDIAWFDHALHYSPLRDNRPDVSLTIRILHKRDLEDPVDDCEVRCLTEMTERLVRLGACERRWVAGRVNRR